MKASYFILLFLLMACTSMPKTPQPDVIYLQKYNHCDYWKYQLLKDSIGKKRLIKLIGKKYDILLTNWFVATPIEVTDGMLYVWGMQAHSGNYTSGMLMIDLKKNIIYVGVRVEGKTEIFSEYGDDFPQQIVDFGNGKM